MRPFKCADGYLSKYEELYKFIFFCSAEQGALFD